MTNPVYVLDTQSLIWFAKGYAHRLGLNALIAMLSPRARVVIPSFALEEIHQKFGPKMQPNTDPAIPPAALLRLVNKCQNVRVLARGPSVLAREIQLKTNERSNGLNRNRQDIPIAAAVLVVREYYREQVLLITCDRPLTIWAAKTGIRVLWNQRPVEWLPG